MSASSGRRVFLASGSRPIRDTLASILAPYAVTFVHGTSVEDCRQSRQAEGCDLLIVDLDGQTTQGLQLLAEWEQTLPHIPKLAIVDRGAISTAVQAIKAGAADCIEKPVVAGRVLPVFDGLFRVIDSNNRKAEPVLTNAEAAVLHLVLQGRTSREIAHVLHRSPRTIDVHRKSIRRKLGASCLADLVKEAAKRGFFDRPD
ncbi:MAG: response regulator [Sedimentisphaerales bacterium]|nr:response regulator [Sedimentisphaerales bacterium]